MANIDSDLIRGNIDTIILKTMLEEDKYGLDIIKEVENKSNGTYELKQPTLYSCLKRLENQELISSYWVDSDIGGRRHYYKLTDKGREFYNKKQEEWSKSKFIIDNLLSSFNDEEYRLVKKEDYDKILEKKEEALSQNNTAEDEDIAGEQEAGEQISESDEKEAEYDEQSPDEDTTYEQVDESEEDEQPINQDSSDENVYSDEMTDENDEIIENEEIDTNDENDYQADEEEYSETLDNLESTDETSDDGIDKDDYDKSSKPEFITYQNENENFDSQEDDELLDSDELDTADEYADEQTDSDASGMEINYFNSPLNESETDENAGEYENVQSESEYDNDYNNYSSQEENFLSSLRARDDEEINQYYGDKQTYANQLSRKQDDEAEVVQDAFDFGDDQSSVDKKVEEFNDKITKLNQFNFGGNVDEDETQYEQFDDENEQSEIEEPSFNDVKELYGENNFTENDDIMSELDNIGDDNLASFANANDYEDSDFAATHRNYEKNLQDGLTFDHFDQTESSDEEGEKLEIYDYNDDAFDEENKTEITEDTEEFDTQTQSYDELYRPSNFDEIISKNVNSNLSSQHDYSNTYVGETNYKEKLSNLSQYSQMSINSNNAKKEVEIPKIEKIDFNDFKNNLSEEGITVKEFEKFNSKDDTEKNYLLVNKINLVKSLIMFFGYVFMLSSVYIILNNLPFKDTLDFSFKYFVYGFIPFGAFLLYRLVVYIIDPYKKAPAKVPTRILLFISFIITIQLLLITYCVNLQMGFYSFSQVNYNHLLWLIPTIVSFAPLISTSVYMILFYSQNFNV